MVGRAPAFGLATLVCVAGAVAIATGVAPEDDPAVLEGRVVSVQDGDTFTLRVGGATERVERVRIRGIDAPENGQPWTRRSKAALSERIFGKDVHVLDLGVDRYGRTLGEVYADDVCVGCELVREGHAWVYRRYDDDPVLIGLEAEAREARRGLWSLPPSERVAPWEWRKGKRIAPAEKAETPATFTCGTKHHCQEMTSCEEAVFFLEECGVDGIDGDADGVPCEKL